MVKLLCISDTTVETLESAANLRRRYSDIDAVISCGDMPVAYLDFIITILGIPLFYVRGNHDENYEEMPPGGTDLHRRMVSFKGLNFMGLEGSIRYNNGKVQYTQGEMLGMVIRMAPAVQMRRLRHGIGIDLFVAHSPARGIHDAEDRPHHGFEAFLRLMDWYRPRYMVHGHVHTWDRRNTVRTQYKDTQVLNINPYTVLTIEPQT